MDQSKKYQQILRWQLCLNPIGNLFIRECKTNWQPFHLRDIAKVCFAQCSTSRLALGSPGCSFVRLSSSPCPEYLIKPYNAIFFKCPGSEDIKTDMHNCQIHKYTYTNTQIQLMTKCQEYQTSQLLEYVIPPPPQRKKRANTLSNV